MTDGGIDFIAQ